MYVIVRVKGTIRVIPDIKKTLELLALNHCNHCVLVDETPQMKGMLQKAKDYITWGEIEAPILSKLLKYRGRIEGDKHLTPEILKAATGSESFDDIAIALIENKVVFREVEKKMGMKRVMRLHPPAKGYEGIKRSYRAGGAMGYRGADINKLIARMLATDEPKVEGAGKPNKKAVS